MRRFKNDSGSPKRIWFLLREHVCEIRKMTASLDVTEWVSTPYEIIMGKEPDISVLIQFSWYEIFYYLDNNGDQKLDSLLGHVDNHGGGD